MVVRDTGIRPGILGLVRHVQLVVVVLYVVFVEEVSTTEISLAITRHHQADSAVRYRKSMESNGSRMSRQNRPYGTAADSDVFLCYFLFYRLHSISILKHPHFKKFLLEIGNQKLLAGS
jgi:hypothetical protein